MMNYEEYHARCAHALTCPHDMVWMVEPLVTQLNDPETPVLLPDQQYLGSLLNHLAEQIDVKDNQINRSIEIMNEGRDMVGDAADRLEDVTRRFAIASCAAIMLGGMVIGLLLK